MISTYGKVGWENCLSEFTLTFISWMPYTWWKKSLEAVGSSWKSKTQVTTTFFLISSFAEDISWPCLYIPFAPKMRYDGASLDVKEMNGKITSTNNCIFWILIVHWSLLLAAIDSKKDGASVKLVTVSRKIQQTRSCYFPVTQSLRGKHINITLWFSLEFDRLQREVGFWSKKSESSKSYIKKKKNINSFLKHQQQQLFFVYSLV